MNSRPGWALCVRSDLSHSPARSPVDSWPSLDLLGLPFSTPSPGICPGAGSDLSLHYVITKPFTPGNNATSAGDCLPAQTQPFPIHRPSSIISFRRLYIHISLKTPNWDLIQETNFPPMKNTILTRNITFNHSFSQFSLRSQIRKPSCRLCHSGMIIAHTALYYKLIWWLTFIWYWTMRLLPRSHSFGNFLG
jgi:hypothetical protein